MISFASSGNQIAAEQTRMLPAKAFLTADRIDDATHALKGAEDFMTRDHRVARADALPLLGDAHGRAGRYDETFAAYDSCLSVCQSLRDRPRQGRALAHRGGCTHGAARRVRRGPRGAKRSR